MEENNNHSGIKYVMQPASNTREAKGMEINCDLTDACVSGESVYEVLAESLVRKEGRLVNQVVVCKSPGVVERTVAAARLADYIEILERGNEEIPMRVEDGRSVLLLDLVSIQLENETEDDASALQQLMMAPVKIEAQNVQVELSQKYSFVIFKGLSEKEEDMDMVTGCDAEACFVVVSDSDQPFVRKLLLNHGFALAKLPVPEESFYLSVAEAQMKGSGLKFSSELTPRELLRFMRRLGKDELQEEQLPALMERLTEYLACERSGKPPVAEVTTEILEEALGMKWVDEVSLDQLTGLLSVRKFVRKILFLENEKRQNGRLHFRNNAMFLGNPGTGKSTCARLVYREMVKAGFLTGSFVSCTRADCIGKYLGETAFRLKKLFARAKDGMLFIDEAGFLVREPNNVYVHEMVKELVRYMEAPEYVNTMVVFAMYKSEAEEFLRLDGGLASRIQNQLVFEDYTEDEFLEICRNMLRKNGYGMEEAAAEAVRDFFRQQKAKRGESFGNAREGRQLVEQAILKIAEYNYTCPGEPRTVATREDVAGAAAECLDKKEAKKTVGFKQEVA